MADYPCDIHRARYSGPSTRIYLNMYREEEVVSLKGSICPVCLPEVMDGWVNWCLHQVPGGGWDPIPEGTALDALWQAAEKPLSARNGRGRY